MHVCPTRRGPPTDYGRRYVRWVPSVGKYQARLSIGTCRADWQSVNLGLYPTLRAAGVVLDYVLARVKPDRATPADVWEAVKPVIGTIAPAGLLPKWVYERKDGRFGARAVKDGRRLELAESHCTAERACRAMGRLIERECPGVVRPGREGVVAVIMIGGHPVRLPAGVGAGGYAEVAAVAAMMRRVPA